MSLGLYQHNICMKQQMFVLSLYCSVGIAERIFLFSCLKIPEEVDGEDVIKRNRPCW